MPSLGTSILSARIKDKDKDTFMDTAERNNIPVSKLLHIIAEGLRLGTIYVDGDEIKGVTPDEIDLTELKSVAERHRKTPQQVLDMMLEAVETW